MIKSDFGKVEIHGNKVLLQAELCSILRVFLKEEIIQDKEKLDDIIEKAMMSNEELKENIINKNLSSKDMQELLNKLVEARKSGLVRKEKEKEDEEIKVTKILDNDNFKITKVELNGDGKTKEEIGDILKKLFEEGEIT